MLKQLVADNELRIQGLRAALAEKYLRVPRLGDAVDAMKWAGASERTAYNLACMARRNFQCRTQGLAGHDVQRKRLRELAQQRPQFGSPRLTALVRRKMESANHKRVERVYGEEGTQLPRRNRHRCRGASGESLVEALTGPNQRWPKDFVHDSMLKAGGCVP